jgi:HSP20 family protein
MIKSVNLLKKNPYVQDSRKQVKDFFCLQSESIVLALFTFRKIPIIQNYRRNIMDYIKIRFGDELDHIGSQFEKTIEEMFRSMSPVFSTAERTWQPQMDVYETDDDIIVLAEIAGVSKENIQIEIDSRAIRIRGRRNELSKLRNTKYRLAEIQFGSFERSLAFPVKIDADNVKAAFTDGFLQVVLPKKRLEEPKRVPIVEG